MLSPMSTVVRGREHEQGPHETPEDATRRLAPAEPLIGKAPAAFWPAPTIRAGTFETLLRRVGEHTARQAGWTNSPHLRVIYDTTYTGTDRRFMWDLAPHVGAPARFDGYAALTITTAGWTDGLPPLRALRRLAIDVAYQTTPMMQAVRATLMAPGVVGVAFMGQATEGDLTRYTVGQDLDGMRYVVRKARGRKAESGRGVLGLVHPQIAASLGLLVSVAQGIAAPPRGEFASAYPDLVIVDDPSAAVTVLVDDAS